MSVERSVVLSAAPIATVDAQHPWLGLVSFTEETRAYFHGREEEGAELSRRVQRKLLTVLFGQSGLGKTSILQAGLVPRLRPEGFCPVYVRLDYDPHSPSPAEQIKRAVFRATEAAGKWTQVGSAVTGETLWEFLHHREDVLKDANGRTLIPILIFDQFEEIFTLAQSDDAGRKRAQEFLADLADLVENRPPVALEARIERDEADAARFDFARADYRILISLREDYLAHLEGLKSQMPSVTQNRMRLARMTGAQAVAAVRAPAPHLVSEAVAEAVVRFVAGGADLARAEVEPSLLSLICRELNNARLAGGHAEISADLLAGSRDTILSEFYERALADQPPGVRIFIEDEMLTESGFRESVAEERVRKGFVAAGAKPEALAQLVDRRLLRVEDRLDLRRVEITHDVLCSVISASRNVRHEREALEESKRQLAAQQEREAATHRALVRARLVAAIAIVLMVLSAGSAVFGWINLRRARAADAEAQASRQLAERARVESEKLIAFLLEDFYEELKPTGRGEIIGKLADKAVAYYDGLPPELMTPQTRLYRGMALVRKASSLGDGGNEPEARKYSLQAQKIFAEMRASGNQSDEVATALALAMFADPSLGGLGDSRQKLEQATGLLRPIVKSGRASRSTKLALADMLQYLAHTETAEEGLASCEASRQLLAEVGALDQSDLTAASIYGDVTDTQSRMALKLGRLDDAERLARIVSDISEKVLEQRPSDLRAMRNRYYSANVLGRVSRYRHDLANAEKYYAKATEATITYVRFNPADSTAWSNLTTGLNDEAFNLADLGRYSSALAKFRTATALEHDPRNKTGLNFFMFVAWRSILGIESRFGHVSAAREAIAETSRIRPELKKAYNLDAEVMGISDVETAAAEFDLLAAKGDFAAIHSQVGELRDRLGKIKQLGAGNQNYRADLERRFMVWQVESALRVANFEEAVSVARDFVTNPRVGGLEKLPLEFVTMAMKTRLAQGLLATDRRADGVGMLREVVAYFRAEKAKGAAETDFRQEFSRALYQLALAQSGDDAGRAERTALLDEADAVLTSLSLEAKQLAVSKDLIQWVSAARAGGTAGG